MEEQLNYMELSSVEFAEILASKAPTPGGGGAAALVGALAAALGEMVGNLTVGKKKYAAAEAELRDCLEELGSLRKTLLDYVREDAEAFAPLSAAYAIPKENPTRGPTLEHCLQMAAEPPMKMLRACCRVIELQEIMAEKGSVLAVSDAGCGAALAGAALSAAALNVCVNTRLMTDSARARVLNDETEERLRHYGPMADRIYANVYARLQ